MNSAQRALVNAARSCSLEATRADRRGERRFARQLRASARRAWFQAAIEGPDLVVKAIACIKNAVALASDLPARDDDASSHDVAVASIHTHVKSARGHLEAYLNPMNPKASRRLRAGKTKPSGTSPSGTDNDVNYDAVDGHPDLLRALDSLANANGTADLLSDLLDDESERNKTAGDMHFHCRNCDESLQAYHDVVMADPEAEKRRNIARAYAKTVAVGLH
jgi:hypothetical protein